MVSAPVPALPTKRLPLLVQAEPVPVTVAVPWEPVSLPTTPIAPLTRPPAAMVSMPVPASPMTRFPLLVQVEPAPVTVTVP
jgi:hypothetical protein